MRLIRYWINTGAAYPGTYGALGSGMIGRMLRNVADREPVENRLWDEAREVIQKNCKDCHKELMNDICDERNLTWWNSRNELMNNPSSRSHYEEKIRFSRHILYDLTETSQSTLLLAPLGQKNGGYGQCKNRQGKPIFNSTEDKQYQILLQAIEHTKHYLDSVKRFDMEGFVVRPEYFREMKRFGILDQDTEIQEVDPYKTDSLYWEANGK